MLFVDVEREDHALAAGLPEGISRCEGEVSELPLTRSIGVDKEDRELAAPLTAEEQLGSVRRPGVQPLWRRLSDVLLRATP